MYVKDVNRSQEKDTSIKKRPRNIQAQNKIIESLKWLLTLKCFEPTYCRSVKCTSVILCRRKRVI